MGWGGLSMGGSTHLHFIHGQTMYAQGCLDDVPRSMVLPYAGAVIGPAFVLMDDNAHPHRARVVN